MIMKKDLESLRPSEIWSVFGQILQVPRPSHHEEKIRDFVMDFGNKQGLETFKDEAGNVIIRKPATPGMENRKGVILQGHLDMVPQKNSDKVHDFEKDPIEAVIDGEWVRANETTLGSDNGIGVSAILAVLASAKISHGPVEALFTATEETGMDGANGLAMGTVSVGLVALAVISLAAGAPYNVSLFLLSSVLNPFFYPAALAAGALRLGIRRYFFVCWAGKTIKGMTIAYAGFFGLRSLLHMLGMPS